MRALAVTVSNRAAAGVYPDRSGPVLVDLLRRAGCEVVDGPLVIPDGEPVEEALRDSISAGYDVVVTTGGTGLTPADLTPEMTRRILDREIPGIAEAIRMAGANAGVPTAILSRGIAGLAGRTLIVNLPGSTGGVKDGMAVLSRHPRARRRPGARRGSPPRPRGRTRRRIGLGAGHRARRGGRWQAHSDPAAISLVIDLAVFRWRPADYQGMIDPVGRMRGWPATLYEPRLLDEPIALRPVRVRDARTWREIRVRNAPWLRPWEPTNPETPLYRSSLEPVRVDGPGHAPGGPARARPCRGS